MVHPTCCHYCRTYRAVSQIMRLPIAPLAFSRRLPTSLLSNSIPYVSRTQVKPKSTRIQVRRLATMAQSHACCTVPPVVSKGYQEKGKWITIDGMKTYKTGPDSAKSALLVVYDIFGFFPQTIQGADILAHSDKEHQYQVFMPG